MATPIKTCSACKAALPIDIFGIASGYRDGRRGQCNPCRTRKQAERLRTNPSARRTRQQMRQNDLRQRYGMTLQEYSRMEHKQAGRCKICEQSTAQLVVDHCHESGKIRGLLCRRCNLALGAVGDNLDGIKKYVSYLLEAKRQLHPGCTI